MEIMLIIKLFIILLVSCNCSTQSKPQSTINTINKLLTQINSSEPNSGIGLRSLRNTLYPPCINTSKPPCSLHGMNYDLIQTLGKGTDGTVFKVSTPNGKIFAMKFTDSILYQHYLPEYRVAHMMKNATKDLSLQFNTVKVYDYVRQRYELNGKKMIKNVMVMRYYRYGTLKQLASNTMKLNITDRLLNRDRIVFHFLKQVGNMLHVCWQNGIIHRDINWNNIMIDGDTFEQMKFVVIDYSRAITVEDAEKELSSQNGRENLFSHLSTHVKF